MNKTLAFCIILTSILSTGCANIISAASNSPIDEDYGNRAVGDFINDEVIEVKARVNLLQGKDQLQDSSVSITSFNGIVLLTGQSPSEEARSLIENIVSKVRKVRKIHNEIQISGNPSSLNSASDLWVTLKTKSKLFNNDITPASRTKIVTENSTVYLMGLLTKAEAEATIEAISKTDGVQKIVKIFEYID